MELIPEEQTQNEQISDTLLPNIVPVDESAQKDVRMFIPQPETSAYISEELPEINPGSFIDRTEKFFQLTEGSQERLDSFIDHIKSGYIPVIYANHQSYIDTVILLHLTRQIVEREPSVKGFVVPAAQSVLEGDKFALTKTVFETFKPVLHERGLYPVGVIRNEDRQVHGMHGLSMESVRTFMSAPKNNFGIALFPEGTDSGGMMDENGNIEGMKEAKDGGKLLIGFVSAWQAKGRGCVLLPVGIRNSYSTFAHNDHDLLNVWDQIVGSQEIDPNTEIALGKPLTSRDIELELGEPLDRKSPNHTTYLMHQLAALLPPEAQGLYKATPESKKQASIPVRNIAG